MSEAQSGEVSEGEIATALVERIQAGDQAAATALYERYHRGLSYLLRRLGAPADQAEDLLQETFRIVLERLRERGLEQPAGLVGFLRGTARNLFLAERRQGRRTSAEDLTGLEETPDRRESQLGEVLREEEIRAVRRMIGELPNPRDREVLYRFYVAEDDKEIICADLELSSLHFNRVIYRARGRFRELFEDFQTRTRRAAAGLAAFLYFGFSPLRHAG